METDTPGTSEPIRFRTGKKRKAFRQRAADTSDQNSSHTTPADNGAAAATAPENDDEESAIQAALKLRNARKNKFRGGVGFSASGATNEGDASADQQQLVLREEDATSAATRGIPDRFTHQTGFVVDEDDRHMLEYIESRLSSRSGAATSAAAQDESKTAEQQANMPRNSAANGPEQSTSRGKLLEVDLPADTAPAHNKRKAQNSLPGAPPAPPRRRRNRRGSEDIKRDELVEKLLHENRLDVYDTAAATRAATAAVTAQNPSTTSVDDQLAEEFQRQYMDEVAARRQRRKPAINQPRTGAAAQQQAASEDVLRGPKLGGSRNSRAAIRDILLSKQEAAKKAR